MLLEKSPISLVVVVCLLTIYGLFSIKENVLMMRAELSEVNNQIRHELDTIHLLKAELAYLSSPERLRELNDKYLKLADTQLTQIDSDLGEEVAAPKTAIISSALPNKHVKWRYRKGPSKYLTVTAVKKK